MGILPHALAKSPVGGQPICRNRELVMSVSPEDRARLWGVIVAYGLEEEYERDLLGRIKSRRTKRYLRAEITPELAQMIAGLHVQLGVVARNAKAAMASPAEAFRRALSKQEIDGHE